MKIISRALTACFILIAAPTLAADVPPSFADLVAKLTPAVVNISTTQKVKGGGGMQMLEMPEGGDVPEEFKDFFDQFGHPGGKGKGKGQGKEAEREVYSLGSGFIIDENGYIATNNHVIAGAEEVTVTLSDDTQLKAKVVGHDNKTDLALLKVDAGKKLPTVVMGDSEASRVGDWVIAIGNPYGLGGTVTAGIISARARNINAGPFDDFIQTDAAINRGNSGGPMFNMKGEVIGINSAIFSPSGGSIGIGFAVPTVLAKPIFDGLRKTGHIDRGWLGVKIQHVTDEIADSLSLPKASGALVMEVSPDTPAAKAGVQSGDVIIRFDGKEVKEMHNLPLMVADTPIGKTVEMDVWRSGQTRTLHVKVGELKEKADAGDGEESEDESPAPTAPAVKPKEMLGLSLVPLSQDLRAQYGIAADAKGVVVTRVKDGSEAMKRGFQPGDVITQVGEKAVGSTKEVADAVAAAKASGRKFVLVRVSRAHDALFVTLPLEEAKK